MSIVPEHTSLQAELSRLDEATPARTLIDIFTSMVEKYPDESALDNGDVRLSYRELADHSAAIAFQLEACGVRRGDRVGVRLSSGTTELYISILGILAAGAAYVPVDADDPDERAELVFTEAQVRGTISGEGIFSSRDEKTGTFEYGGTLDFELLGSDLELHHTPQPADDAWVIFTSGSTGKPKGVAVSHRSAAAFVDAESEMFLQSDPLGPQDRVLAGLSVAFDASCEEMWLAWGHGACLVPAPRSLVRSGSDLGPWLMANGITVVSTVPTLAAMWPEDALENIRLLIFGGEAFPVELAEKLAVPGREVWNTYGPTEATVVACGALATGVGPMRIGLPLAGWDLAVVDVLGNRVAPGETGELIIGGVGLARYLDEEKDAQVYAPFPTLGWERAYRSGDMIRYEPEGLIFVGRVDDQVKIGGRRIELGEIESALSALPNVTASAVVVQQTAAGNKVLVGYLSVVDTTAFSTEDAVAALRKSLPAPLVPLLVPLAELPVRTSGKVDKAALPWPLETPELEDLGLSDIERRVASEWAQVLGVPVTDLNTHFFDIGGGSLAAAQLVGRLRSIDSNMTVADIYAHPRLGSMADFIAHNTDDLTAEPHNFHKSEKVPRSPQLIQALLSIPLYGLAGLRWLFYALTASTVVNSLGIVHFLPAISWSILIPGVLIFGSPWGRMFLSVLISRLVLSGVGPGNYRRGGSTHLRLWFAEQAAAHIGAVTLAGAPWVTAYARALGARIGKGVTMHTLPPVTGMLFVGEGASIEPEVDLTGYWIDGDVVRIGEIRIGAHSTIGARSTLAPGTRIAKFAEIAPGSSVFGKVAAGQLWSGSPAKREGKVKAWWPEEPARQSRAWGALFALSSGLFSLFPLIALLGGASVIASSLHNVQSAAEALGIIGKLFIPATLLSGFIFALLVLASVRLLSVTMREGVFPVHSWAGWQAWSIERILDLARTFLFPLYSSLFTPIWLRLLGAKVGKNVEASTVLMLPKMSTISDDVFLADDTMIAPYSLGNGWMYIGPVEIGKRAFIGNSGLAPAGRKVPKDALVAVLSSAPRKAKEGSSWLGSPPMRLRRLIAEGDRERTYLPSTGLRLARSIWELTRFIPVLVTALIGFAVASTLLLVTHFWGFWIALLLSGPSLWAAGIVAAGITTAAKWILVGRITPQEKPLWSSFIWRNEVADTFVEMVAAPWFANYMNGTLGLVWWLRSLGASIGGGVWCETYWLPEADLVTLGDGATVNRGTVLQTHLFHDRVMSMDRVVVETGGTLGPHSVLLPAAQIGAHSTVGPASLVMRGELVPEGSRWSGNPIGPWREVTVRKYFSHTGAIKTV
ncbi:Pls/PosA family non-ribosomal peptide synthetase [Aurantimicrobium minutum]|uniref:Pls/PosA family non-ribosomal peptide synthetase n=1 Tax=Aurantimicrobium minutum TaxID=708131 RepID=UPI002473B049|nr:Pls/PosA family non-ribosomal peptide synthetase [Aurantimicrobium minutum]